MRKINIHPVQIMTATISATLGISILAIQRELVKIANQDAWISMLLGSMIAVLLSMFVTYNLAKLYPKNDFPRISLLVLGKLAGRVVLAFYLVIGLATGGFSLRIFVHTLKIFLLDRTPVTALVILIAVGIISVVKRGLNAIIGSIDFMFPTFLIPLIMLIVLPVARVDIGNLKPVLFENTMNVLKGTIPSFSVFIGCGIVNYLHPYVSDIKGIFRWLVIGMLVSTVLYVSVTAMTIMLFGSEEIKILMYPTLILSKSIEFPVTVFERLETLIVIIWIPGFFAWLILYTYAMVRNTCEIFSLKPKHYKKVVYILLFIMSVIAIFPRSSISAGEFLQYFSYFNAFGFAVIVPIITVIAFIKKGRKKCL